jgi:hypothetical protein
MSGDDDDAPFTDTSVCFNFVFEDDGGHARQLFVTDPCDVVTSESVEREFDGVVQRRQRVCDDLLPYAKRNAMDEFEPSRAESLSENDWSFIDEFKRELGTLDPDEAIRRVNRRQRQLENAQRILFGQDSDLLTVVPVAGRDGQLMGNLRSVVENEADCRIICDAVEWNRSGGSGVFLTSDREDTLGTSREDDNGRDEHPTDENGSPGLSGSFLGFVGGDDRTRPERINDCIEQRYAETAELDIRSVPEFLAR